MPSADEVRAFLTAEFPQNTVEVVSTGDRRAHVRQAVGPAQLRPGGTVSGPVMMAVADAAAYAAILGTVGIVPLAVTTSIHMSFLRRPRADRDVVADAELIKVGKQLVVADVRLYSEGEPDLIAQSTATYALPPSRA